MPSPFDRLMTAARSYNDSIELDADLARALNVSSQTIHNWQARGRVSKEGALEAERKFGVPASWILTGEGDHPPAKRLHSKSNALLGSKLGVPVMGEARLGDQGFYEESSFGASDGFVKYPMDDPDSFALRCKGDSMRPRIKPGQFVIVQPRMPVTLGDEVAVRTRDGRQMIKVFALKKDGLVHLASINEDHKTITLEEHEILQMHHVGGIMNASMYYPD
jgi:phage repressor protein C with HTH and peptisase S24 domain